MRFIATIIVVLGFLPIGLLLTYGVVAWPLSFFYVVINGDYDPFAVLILFGVPMGIAGLVGICALTAKALNPAALVFRPWKLLLLVSMGVAAILAAGEVMLFKSGGAWAIYVPLAITFCLTLRAGGYLFLGREHPEEDSPEHKN